MKAIGTIELAMIVGLVVGIVVIILLLRALTAGERKHKRLMRSLSDDPDTAEAIHQTMLWRLDQARQYGVEHGMSQEEARMRHAELLDMYYSGDWKSDPSQRGKK